MSSARKGLPTNIAASLGRIVSRWAYQESLLYLISYEVLSVTPKQGRVAVRHPRASDVIEMIEDLLLLRGISVAPELTQLKADIVEVLRRRDLLVHSVWLQHKGKVAIQDTRGKWQRKPRITKKMQPAPKTITPEYLKRLKDDLESTIARTERLRSAINSALASQGISH